ncbi:hypothetical protein K435DRAFT_860530 [Dendrothele bispora CBS 962.96]|uniref:Uncharacterized protein n=1 Tax=Dendrothele bispora (strain CBS 962.96) TaxID=1314807 RepID=A0A4S8LXR7_DENBC|nr:hypothetical protein K435DRAFT_860530 [Dendrothele bispora CBS 962.96]
MFAKLASFTVVCSTILLRLYYPFTDWPIPDSARTTLKDLTCFLVVAGGIIGAIVPYLAAVSMLYFLLSQIIIYVVARFKFSSTIKARVERYHEAEKAYLRKDTSGKPYLDNKHDITRNYC